MYGFLINLKIKYGMLWVSYEMQLESWLKTNVPGWMWTCTEILELGNPLQDYISIESWAVSLETKLVLITLYSEFIGLHAAASMQNQQL